MADGEPEVVEQFHGILACGTLGGRLIIAGAPIHHPRSADLVAVFEITSEIWLLYENG